jgi:hypothetical protein
MCGVSINPLNLNTPQYRLASTATYILVSDAPDTIYEIQVDGTTYPAGSAGIIAAAGFNKNYNVSDAGGSTTTGQSGMQILTSSAATTATLPLKAVGARQQVDNDITTANAKLLVLINNQQFSGGTGTLAV